MLFQTISIRMIVIFIGFGSIIIFFLYLAYKILRHYRNRLNVIFSFYYITVAIALIINIIFSLLTNQNLIKILCFIVFFLTAVSLIFITTFCISFFKGEEYFNLTKQIILIVIYVILLSFMFFIPDGVKVNADTDWGPILSWQLFIFLFLVTIPISVIPSLYFMYKIYQKFDDPQLKKKWKFFILGSCILYFAVLGTYFVDVLNITTVRRIWTIVLMPSTFFGAYFTYYGVAGKV